MTGSSLLHEAHMREAFAVARRARAHGNRAFGALLVAGNGAVLAAAENSQLTDEHVLAHAEMNLLQRAAREFPADVLATSTIYTSAEPCAMCAGAIFWSGVGRLVYGLSGDRLHRLSGLNPQMLVASARQVLSNASRTVDVIGPILEAEAESLFADDIIGDR
jgi:tRNA(adenine34) deaminase